MQLISNMTIVHILHLNTQPFFIVSNGPIITWYLRGTYITYFVLQSSALRWLHLWLITEFSIIATLGLHLGFSAKLRTWQVSACKMEPRSGTKIIGPPTHPPTQPSTELVICTESLFWCAVSPTPPNLVLCLNTLALSGILSKIENLASSSLQNEAKLNLYPRVWHS